MNTLENLYYGNIDPHEHTVSNGTDKGEFLETVVRPETKLRAALTEQQKALLEQFEKADAEITTGMSYKRSQTDFDWQLG